MKIIPAEVSWAQAFPRRFVREIDTIVLHSTEEPTLQDARRIAERHPDHACAHYYIDRDGVVYQWVPDERVAWHAKGANSRSIGIELVNTGRYPHHHASWNQNPSEPFPPAQIEALLELLHHLRHKYPNLRRLVRHSDLDSSMIIASDAPSQRVHRKIDPGPMFPWNKVLDHWRSLGYSEPSG